MPASNHVDVSSRNGPPQMPDPRPELIVVCTNRRYGSQPSCAQRGSLELVAYLEAGLAARGLPQTVKRAVCLGHCAEGPTVRLAPGGRFLLAPSIRDLDVLLDSLTVE